MKKTKEIKNFLSQGPLAALSYRVPLGNSGATYDIAEHRRKLMSLQPPMPSAPQILKTPLFIPHADDKQIPVSLYRPKKAPACGEFPTLIYVGGTAYIAHETAYTDAFCTQISALTGCQVLAIHHRVSPESSYLDQVEDVIDATAYIFNQSKLFQLDLNRVVTLGYSSGGTFVTHIGLKAKEQKWPIALQILVSPVLDLARTSKEFESFEKEDKVVPEEFVQWFLKLCLPKNLPPQDPQISPYWIKDLTNLPRTSIFFGEYDRFRGDAEGFAKKIGNNLLTRYACPGQDHGFFWNRPEFFNLIAANIQTTFSFNIPKPMIFLNANSYHQVTKVGKDRHHSMSLSDEGKVHRHHPHETNHNDILHSTRTSSKTILKGKVRSAPLVKQ